MTSPRATATTAYAQMGDLALAQRISERDYGAVRFVTTSYNQALFRAAWSVLRSRPEAEDALQDGYLKAFRAIGSFSGQASLKTWLTRIVINEALARRRSAQRRKRRLEGSGVAVIEDYREALMQGSDHPSSDRIAARRQIAEVLERAISQLPDPFRVVLVLRDIDELSIHETAAALSLNEQTVRTRHLRARRRLRESLGAELREALADTFSFAGADCAAMTQRVVAGLMCD